MVSTLRGGVLTYLFAKMAAICCGGGQASEEMGYECE